MVATNIFEAMGVMKEWMVATIVRSVVEAMTVIARTVVVMVVVPTPIVATMVSKGNALRTECDRWRTKYTE